MMKKILLGFVILLLVIMLGSGGWWFWHQEKPGTEVMPPDYKNLTYTVENQQVALVDGYSQVPAVPGSASMVTTKYFGNEVIGDLNGDGVNDTAFLLTQETGGSGVFYYLAVALKANDGWTPVDTIFLGDRIAPQNTQINNAELLVNYATRKPDEPMTNTPSVGVSKYFKIENGKLVEQIDKAAFGVPVSLVVNQQVKFEDGLQVSLKQINDSRCKKGTVCVWAGELSPVLTVIGGNFGQNSEDIALGSVKTKTVTNNNYTFELKESTEVLAIITVTKKVVELPSCFVGGCNMELCSDRTDMVSSCVYKEEYACYKTAKCEKQQDGKCGWTQTSELAKCLNSSK